MDLVKLKKNGGVEFSLITGSVRVDTPGNYVLATGCGSGKTSAIIELITKVYDQGVIYSAKTIDECTNMYEYLCDNGLKNEVILLHSESVDNSIYLNSPEYIRRYKIVICTHHKLMNTPSELLLTYSNSAADIPPHMRYWNVAPVYKMRKYILVDEMIEKPGFTNMVNKSLIASLQMGVNTGVITKTRYGYNYGEILKWYDEYSNVLKLDSFRSIDKYKIEYTLSLIAEHLDEYVEQLSDESDKVDVSYTLLDLLPGRKAEDFNESFPYFLIFDGTGDIYYKDSRELTILTTDNRYASKIKIHEMIPFNINRYNTQDFNEFNSELSRVVGDIVTVIETHHRTLIVSWMNIKGDLTLTKDSDEFAVMNYQYLDTLRSELNKYSSISESMYELIHYQSGNDRATNEYNDCDAVCFIGVHKVHTMALMKANKYNKSSMTQLDYQAQMIIQAICRTQIRMHDSKKTTDIYFTSDWSEDLINYVQYYVGDNKKMFDIKMLFKDDHWLDFIQPRFRDRIIALDSYFDHKIHDKVMSNIITSDDADVELFIYKYDLMELIPVDGSIHHYDPLLYYLMEFNIRLVIGNPEKKYISVSKDGVLLPYTIYQQEIKKYLEQGYKLETKFIDYHV